MKRYGRRGSSYAMARGRYVTPTVLHLGHVATATTIAIAVIAVAMGCFGF